MPEAGWVMAGVECTSCGDLRTGTAKAGLDEGGHRIRQRECRNCGARFTTVEVPFEFVFNRVDTAKPQREAKRLTAQRKSFSAVPRVANDRFVVTHSADERPGRTPSPSVHIRLVHGRKSDRCRRGLHSLTGTNAIVRADGSRTCRACTNARTRERRRELRRRYPVIAREQDAVKRESMRRRRAATRGLAAA
jgi:hypothetical protein